MGKKKERLPQEKNLTRRGLTYWVQVAVPVEAQPIIGKSMLRHCLQTTDLKEADEDKGEWVTKFRRMIRAAKSGKVLPDMTPKVDTIEAQAMGLRDWQHPDKNLIVGQIADNINLDDPDSPEDAIITGELGQKAYDFYAVAMGIKTPLTAYLKDFVASYKGRAPHTVETRRKDVLRLERWLRKAEGQPTLEAVTRPMANKFKNDMHNDGAKRGTVNKTLGSLRLYWRFLRDHGHVAGENPWSGVTVSAVEAKGTENTPVRDYSDSELRTTIAAAEDDDMRDAMIFAALTGARRGELFRLKFSDCADGLMLLEGTKNESSRRVIPVHPVLAALIEERKKERKPSDYILKDNKDGTRSAVKAGAAFGKRYSRLKTRLFKDPTLNYHSFRHWATMKMRLAGIGDSIIDDVTGHAHKSVTNRVYAAVQKKAQQIQRLDMLSDEEKARIRDFLTPAVEAIKLPTEKATAEANA